MTRRFAPSLAGWPVAEAIAWSLWLAGWIGFAALGVWLAPGQDAAFIPLAACLLGYGLAGSAMARLPASVARSPALPAALAGLYFVLQLSLPASRSLALAAAAGLVWAALGALLSRTYPAAAPARGWGALVGAAVAVLVLGDPGDGQGLAQRMALWAALATVLWLAWPRAPSASLGSSVRRGCTCLSAWGGPQRWPESWPERAAALVMIPMMTTLPLTLGLCLGRQWPAQGVLALHLLGMFLPALLLRHRVGTLSPAMLRATLAFLLLLGALLVAPGASRAGSLGLMLLHGTAWGILWAYGLGAASAPRSARSTPLPEAALLAALAFAAGALALRFGPAGVEGIHLALAALAGLGLLSAAAVRAWRGGLFLLGVKS